MKLGENLNLTFGNVIVRNVPEAKKRLEHFRIYADNISLNYEVFDGIRGDLYVPIDYRLKQRPHLYPSPANQYYVGNFLSFLRIHLYAMSKRFSSYIVCDDDTVFVDHNLKLIKNYLPPDWDVVILGSIANKSTSKTNDEIDPVFIKPNTPQIAGSQCIAINSKCYYRILEYLLNFSNHSNFGDIMLDEMSSKKIIQLYAMFPDVSYQERKVLKQYEFI
jgi:hypothetical protein